jgi:hypothetical protein
MNGLGVRILENRHDPHVDLALSGAERGSGSG